MAFAIAGGLLFMATKTRPNQDQIKRKVVDFELKLALEAKGMAGEFEGYCAGIHNIDSVGDMILPGAFADDLPRFLAEGAVCWNHDWMLPIGKPLLAKEDTYGLFVKAQISRTTTGNDIMTLIRDCVVKKMSIGYRVKDYEYVDRAGLLSYLDSTVDPQKTQAILQQYDEADLTELFLIKKLKLYEFSPVTFAANDNATITQAKHDLLAGLSFADHSESVLAAVREYATRAQQITNLRAEQNRTLSHERLAELKGIADALTAALAQLAGIAKPKSNPEATLLLAEHLRQQARGLGVAV